MGKKGRPRCGSMQYWPRKRSKRAYARVRSWPEVKEVKPLAFAGYKAGMTHIHVTDNRPNANTKGEDIVLPVTVIEVPPMKVAGVRFYKKTTYGMKVLTDVLADKLEKELVERKLCKVNKISKKIDDVKEFDEVKLIIYTQPKFVGFKKKPEIFEIAVGGSKDEKLAFCKEKLGAELNVNDVFSEGQLVDSHAITKGKGFQGPVKRFGVAIRESKSEKVKRGPGSIAGGWKAQGHMMYRVAFAGQMGFHQRVQYNNWLLKIGDKPEEINPKGGFLGYGLVKNQYLLIKGSIQGARKRLVTLTVPMRINPKVPSQAPTVQYTSLESKQ